MKAEIQYGIVDVITMIREVADHQDILRSLGKTLLIKILVNKELYRLEITETEAGRDVYFLELSATKRAISKEHPSGGRELDVSVVISSPDLASVLDGSLSPLQAYLTGRISAVGDVRKLMFFDKLSRKAHKPGSTFTV